MKDMSYGKEAVHISCVNAIDRQYPDYVEYASYRIPSKYPDPVEINLDPEFLQCCDCTDNCRVRVLCDVHMSIPECFLAISNCQVSAVIFSYGILFLGFA